MRDPDALEAALFRPRTGYCEDIVAEAAALIESLAINHPFVDGNQRIAFAAADVFLRMNRWRPQRPPMQIYAEMMQVVETGTVDIAHLDPWLHSFARAEGECDAETEGCAAGSISNWEVELRPESRPG